MRENSGQDGEIEEPYWGPSVEALLQGRSLKEYHRGELERKYEISENGLKHVSEDLKQRITAKAKRYKDIRTETNSSHRTDCLKLHRESVMRS